MTTTNPPSWLLPSLSEFSRFRRTAPQTWQVVFICPMEDTERVEMMTELSSVDKNWPDRPSTELRQMVEIPWLMDCVPPTSVIFTILKNDPVIFLDDQSRIDHTAIIAWKSSKESSPEAARVPLGRANMLLAVVAEGGILPPTYPRIQPERSQEPTFKEPNGVLPPHLSGLQLDPSTPTLISLIHLPPVVQENLETMIGHRIIIHNWPPHQEPCSRAQLYRMFQALKIRHPDIDEAFALFIDEDSEGYHVVRARGASGYSVFDPRDKRLELDILSFEKVRDFWTAAWNPYSRTSNRMPRGPYRYNPAMYDVHAHGGGGEPIVDPDDIAGSLGSDVIFVLERMTPSELRQIRTELFPCPDQEYMWVDVADRLASPDMQGLLAYFETSEEFAHHHRNHCPPLQFLAVDRRTLADAMEPADEREDWEAVIVASYEGGDVWFQDETGRSFGYLSTGYGYERRNLEEAEGVYINVNISNMSWSEMCEQSPVVHWSAYRAWAEDPEKESFARSFGPEGMQVSESG
ncbi:hypothetical protein ASPACDRAFT_1854134 [Aspergillus aculeatus ATCC 16872]|uniref:Uncharacterized protein n=1 Tax=Aspergillus aculeatus (strain ATCC 16872 / CBS 172.66 / WB 5094) TaxID=690307 RepID=A0A1L9X1V3_ASPA1|nr:uncharacterized protein ASPACDRAFT_1854134 [Aspergillus aculeatus ATCC 16872]OJK02128.1 hypothetical protein ASPACDRAFT_1854134 [Aspergillus aculeatus ATCC 16872]